MSAHSQEYEHLYRKARDCGGVCRRLRADSFASIRQGAEQSGYAVEGFAPTGRAARQLRDHGHHKMLASTRTTPGYLVKS